MVMVVVLKHMYIDNVLCVIDNTTYLCDCHSPMLQIEMEDTLDITDYKGQKQGSLSVELQPCLPNGSLPSEDEDPFVENPKELASY